MTDNVEKNQSQNPGQPGQQSEQRKQKNPEDVSKKNPSQDSNKEHGEQSGKQDQGGQRRASSVRMWPSPSLARALFVRDSAEFI